MFQSSSHIGTMEQTPRNRFAGRLEEKHEEDVAEAGEILSLVRSFGPILLPVILGIGAFTFFGLKTMALQAPYLFGGVLVVVAAAAFVGWLTVRPKREGR